MLKKESLVESLLSLKSGKNFVVSKVATVFAGV